MNETEVVQKAKILQKRINAGDTKAIGELKRLNYAWGSRKGYILNTYAELTRTVLDLQNRSVALSDERDLSAFRAIQKNLMNSIKILEELSKGD
jgi:hypothetical protein